MVQMNSADAFDHTETAGFSPRELGFAIPVQVELRGVVDVGIEVQLLRRSRSSPLRAGEDSTPEGPGLTSPPSACRDRPPNDYIIRSRHGTSPENPQYPSKIGV